MSPDEMVELDELAGRVEAALEADRELDALIARAVWQPQSGNTIEPCPLDLHAGIERTPEGVISANIRRKEFTASLDAAMTLADDFGGQLTFFKDGSAKAFLWQPYPLAVEGKGATPALALTAACLRALATHRASKEHEDG